MANRWGNNGNSGRLSFLQMVTTAIKLKDAYSLEKSYDQPRQHIKKQRHYFADKGPYSQSYGFSSKSCLNVRVGLQRKLSAKEMMLLNCGVGEDSWTVGESWRLLESPLDCKEIKPVNPKGNQS